MLYGRIRHVFSVIILTTLVLSLAVPAFASGGDAAKGLSRKIVALSPDAVNEVVRAKLEELGGVIEKKIGTPRGPLLVVLLPPQATRAVTQLAGVLRVEDDAVAYALPAKPTPTPSPETTPWGVDRIDAEKVWPIGNTGSGVNVAVLDTGIDLDHPDLAANIKGGINTINSLKTADDDNGHGSHVAGIIAAVDNSIGVIGVAPQASLYAVKVLSKSGSGFVSDIIEGVQWSINSNMKVINMSLGTSADVQSFHDALIDASNAGIVLVAAAGNSGPGDNTVLYPAKYAEVIAVSATDSNDTLASFSSRGPEVEVAAPGVNIYSTYKGGTYKTMSGTSMAAPHVAGTAALVIASGITDASAVMAKLQSTADDKGAVGKDNLYGYGVVDAQEAATGIQSPP